MKMSKDEQRKYREANPDNAGPIYEPEPKWFGSSILPTIILPVAPFGCVCLLACSGRECLGCLPDVDAGGDLGAMAADGSHARRRLPGASRRVEMLGTRTPGM